MKIQIFSCFLNFKYTFQYIWDLNLKIVQEIKKNVSNSAKTEISRLPAQYSSLTPDHNYISGPNATSNNPRDWLLYPTGIIFEINAKNYRSIVLPVKENVQFLQLQDLPEKSRHDFLFFLLYKKA